MFSRSLLLSTTSPSVTKRFVERRVLENTNPYHLFRIIQDVDRYQEFLPLCSHSKVLHVWDEGRLFEATLSVGLPWAAQEEYTSRVSVCPDQLTVETVSIESKVVDSLRSRWKLGEATTKDENDPSVPRCNVDFEVEMTVSSGAIAKVLDRLLEEVACRQVEAFRKRCQEISFPAGLGSK